MRLQIDPSKVTTLFFPAKDRTCPLCGREQRYAYKSSGHHFYRLDGAYYVDGQIVHCWNGLCPLRFKPMHCPEERALVAPKKGYGFDVVACIGRLRFGDRLTRNEIVEWLAKHHPALKISDRQVENIFNLYGALVTGTVLKDADVIATVRTNRAIVLAIDGAKPMQDHDSVWFVRDLMSGITLAALATTSCTVAVLTRLLMPIKLFAKKHKVPIVGVVSDAEPLIRSAVRKVFPRVRHQLCQFHFLKNLAEPLVTEDRKLRDEVKESVRDLTKIQRSIGTEGALTKSQSELLEEVSDAIRSYLRDNGKPPLEPPGLKLVERLTTLRDLVDQMTREKGGPDFGRLSNCSPSRSRSRRTNAGSASSTRRSGRSKRYSEPMVRPSRERSVSSASFENGGSTA